MAADRNRNGATAGESPYSAAFCAGQLERNLPEHSRPVGPVDAQKGSKRRGMAIAAKRGAARGL